MAAQSCPNNVTLKNINPSDVAGVLISFLVAKTLYNSKCPSNCQLRLGENVFFFESYLDKGLI